MKVKIFEILFFKSVMAMKLRIRIILPAFILLGVVGCNNFSGDIETIKGSWKVAEKQVTAGDIRYVSLYVPGHLAIQFGGEPKLRIKADDNVLPYLITRETGERLEVFAKTGVRIGSQSIYTPPGKDDGHYTVSNKVNVHLIPRRRIEYRLTVSGLEGITAWNCGKVTIPNLEEEKISITSGSFGFAIGKLTANKVNLNPGGDANWHDTQMQDMNIESLSAEELKVQINSNQNVNIAGGAVQRQEIIINNEGNYDALNVDCSEAVVQVNGQGSATVRVTKRLIVNLKDFCGDVYYRGNPEIEITGQSENSGKLVKIRD